MGMATTRLRPARRGGQAARRCARLDTKTAGQTEARLEANAAEWRKATGLGNGRAGSGIIFGPKWTDRTGPVTGKLVLKKMVLGSIF